MYLSIKIFLSKFHIVRVPTNIYHMYVHTYMYLQRCTCIVIVQSKLDDGHQHHVMPIDQLLSLATSHLVERGQLIVHHHHHHSSTTYEVRTSSSASKGRPTDMFYYSH